ncbi:MAG TPA: hypothetical protein VIJ34_12750 [Acidimicrobiales bacterium]
MNLRRVGVLSILVMLAQVLLGVNLWVTIGPIRPWSHISHAALLVVHAAVGVALLLLAFLVLVKAFEEASRRDKVSAATAFAGAVGPSVAGSPSWRAVESRGSPSVWHAIGPSRSPPTSTWYLRVGSRPCWESPSRVDRTLNQKPDTYWNPRSSTGV